MTTTLARLAALLAMALLTWEVAPAGEVPVPLLPDLHLIETTEIAGRNCRRYEHANAEAWGYARPQRDVFYVVEPGTLTAAPPLCVVLHSAGGNGATALSRIGPAEMRSFYGDDAFYVLSLDCRSNRNDWWWGYREIQRRPEMYSRQSCPTEHRLEATIQWAINQFAIDPNRVYLCGISMGGSGSLGFGMVRGDAFAAISVVVPAGVEHVFWRTRHGDFADPPPIINVSSQRDPYAAGQDRLLDYCARHRYLQIFGWGPFGHTPNVESVNPAVYEFPWLEIRRDEAYPVFTHAACDDRYPGLQNLRDPDQWGQVNGYFRWRNVEDTAERFAIDLWLVRPAQLRQAVDVPVETTADVTPRRLQQFPIRAGTRCRWTWATEDQLLGDGRAAADDGGLLTIPSLPISIHPARLTLERD